MEPKHHDVIGRDITEEDLVIRIPRSRSSGHVSFNMKWELFRVDKMTDRMVRLVQVDRRTYEDTEDGLREHRYPTDTVVVTDWFR